MTPLQIEIMLHYHCCASDYRDGDFSAPAVRDAIDDFRARGLLKESGNKRVYEPTEGVRLYVDALCAVPAPVQRWVIPLPSAED